MTIDTPPATRRSRLLPQLAKFGAVGAVGVLVNLAVFNLLLLTAMSASHWGALVATVIANAVAIATNYVGNRYWAFAKERRSNVAREGVEFLIVSICGLVIPVLCVYVSRVVLGFDSRLADNIANNVVGLALGTVFRFAFYRWWVFAPHRGGRDAATTTTEPVLTGATALPGTPDGGLVRD
ncbi:GtrA family protein [Leifsonia sp. NCR5]|uniref:GtrA family protein n=1 Tax=Leifsonia sp. NCR5 TaxID=1978342 RepID=UPI000A199BA5|nr:GtrA family protein [Leifsonia sp. NCR5]